MGIVWVTAPLLAAQAALLAQLAVNVRFLARPRRVAAADMESKPALSVLIPARDEALRIGPCLESLAAQDYPLLEVLVLDDQSSDPTAAVARDYSVRLPGLHVMEGRPLPEGWAGKSWACAQLAEAARGTLMLFLDADTRLEPGAVAAAVGMMLERDAELLSLWPGQEMGSWAERAVVPFMHLLVMVFLPHWMPGRFASLGVANGQFLMVRASSYNGVGGHARVGSHLVEDVALARAFRADGRRVVNGLGNGWVRCRMYENLREVWLGFSKNLRAGCGDSSAAFVGLWLALFGVYLLPLVLAAATPWLAGGARVWAVLPLCLLLLLRLVAGRMAWHPVSSTLLHPVGIVLVLAIALDSWRRTLTGGVVWKGRTYGRTGV